MYSRVNVQTIIDESPTSIIFQMNDCRVQSARKRKGLADYPCKSAGLVEYSRFAWGIDDRIRTECIGCPPGGALGGGFCGGGFFLGGGVVCFPSNSFLFLFSTTNKTAGGGGKKQLALFKNKPAAKTLFRCWIHFVTCREELPVLTFIYRTALW